MTIHGEESMRQLGQKIGELLKGGEVIELVGDVGAGKTTFSKGLAQGLEIVEPVQSPTFTISRIYPARDQLELRHYDFYRLGEAGVMGDELSEAVNSPHGITVVEWGGVVDGVLPSDRLQLTIVATSETSREVKLTALGPLSERLIGGLA